MQKALNSDWMSFSLSSSPWIRFSVSPEIEAAFSSDVGASEPEKKQWLFRAESSIMEWVISDMILKEPDRAVQFRNLGRGWVFVLVRRHKRVFKVWFESIRRVEWNHQMDIRTVNLTGNELTKYTRGYLHESEVVFFVKGMVLYGADRSQTSTQGTISIQKFRTDYRGLGKWIGGNQQVQEKCRTSGDLTDEERKMISARTLRKQKKKAQKQHKTLLAASDNAAVASKKGAEGKSARSSATARPIDTAFLKLLESFKMEDARRREDPSHSSATGFAGDGVDDWKSKEGDMEFKGETAAKADSPALHCTASAHDYGKLNVSLSADGEPAPSTEAAAAAATTTAAAATRSRRSGRRRRRRKRNNNKKKKDATAPALPPPTEPTASDTPQQQHNHEGAVAASTAGAASSAVAVAEHSRPDDPSLRSPRADDAITSAAEATDARAVAADGSREGSDGAQRAKTNAGKGSFHIERWFND